MQTALLKQFHSNRKPIQQRCRQENTTKNTSGAERTAVHNSGNNTRSGKAVSEGQSGICADADGCDVLDNDEEIHPLHHVHGGRIWCRAGGLRLGMVHVTSKLCMHKWISRMYVGAPDSLPAFTTSRGAFKTVSVDSAHCLLNRYGNGR